MRRLPIRLKLAVALALPLLALVIVTAIAVRATADTANDTWLIVLTVATVGAAVLLAFVVSRSITQPLRSLTRQAKEMAEHRLPDAVVEILETPLGDDVRPPQATPVTVDTNDEVGDVAEALNSVQETALRLAVEQAVLRRNIADSFVNLGRRNQNLLGRQLDFITELESNETDPDTLASLFRLDHLATRMRRNAESLLVLAGIDPPRKWAAPVRLTDVIRAALGEVEDYQRVTLREVQPATVLGSVAADLAHLIAEFVENALTFSPPNETVSVSGRAVESGYRLAVVDHGLGMDHDDIEQANRRLVGAESFTIAPSKYLGHYVAGNLAARHGVRLMLANMPGTGVAATIDLPPALLTADPAGDPITDPNATAVGPGAPPRAPTPDAVVPAQGGPAVPPMPAVTFSGPAAAPVGPVAAPTGPPMAPAPWPAAPAPPAPPTPVAAAPAAHAGADLPVTPPAADAACPWRPSPSEPKPARGPRAPRRGPATTPTLRWPGASAPPVPACRCWAAPPPPRAWPAGAPPAASPSASGGPSRPPATTAGAPAARAGPACGARRAPRRRPPTTPTPSWPTSPGRSRTSRAARTAARRPTPPGRDSAR